MMINAVTICTILVVTAVLITFVSDPIEKSVIKRSLYRKSKFHCFMKGTGGLYHYAFGVASCLEQYFEAESLHNDVHFHTVSGSALSVAALLSPTASVSDMYFAWCKTLKVMLSNESVTATFYDHVEDMVHKYVANVDPPSNHQIYVSRKLRGEGHVAETRQQYQQLIVASSLVPLLTPSPFDAAKSVDKLGRYIDGCLCVTRRSPFKKCWFDALTFLNYNSLGRVALAYWFVVGFISPSASHVFRAGFDDAKRVLIPELRWRGLKLKAP